MRIFPNWLHRVQDSAQEPSLKPHESAQTVDTVLALSMVIEARDPYTAGHQWRVSRFVRLIADYAGLSPAEAATCELAGFIHDVGKIGIPDAVLQKSSRLDEQEFDVMKTHPNLGGHLVFGNTFGPSVIDAVLHHHERPDGKGYPDGLSEDALSTTAAIVCIGDSLDAMTSDRPYRKGMSLERALDILREERGRQFVAKWVDVLQDRVPRSALAHVVEHSAPGLPLQHCPMCHGPIAQPLDRGIRIDACRICGADLVQDAQGLRPTGKKASAEQLAPRADLLLIATITDRLQGEIAAQ